MAFVMAIPAVAAASAAWYYSGSGATMEPAGEPEDLPPKETKETKEGAYVFDEEAEEAAEEAAAQLGPDKEAAGEAGRTEMEEAEVEAEAEAERFSRVQRLVRDAVLLYRARGYGGTITVSQVRLQSYSMCSDACVAEAANPS